MVYLRAERAMQTYSFGNSSGAWYLATKLLFGDAPGTQIRNPKLKKTLQKTLQKERLVEEDSPTGIPSAEELIEFETGTHLGTTEEILAAGDTLYDEEIKNSRCTEALLPPAKLAGHYSRDVVVLRLVGLGELEKQPWATDPCWNSREKISGGRYALGTLIPGTDIWRLSFGKFLPATLSSLRGDYSGNFVNSHGWGEELAGFMELQNAIQNSINNNVMGLLKNSLPNSEDPELAELDEDKKLQFTKEKEKKLKEKLASYFSTPSTQKEELPAVTRDNDELMK